MVTISWILVTSLAAYILFYNKYVPPITHVQPIWFNYGQDIVPQPPSAVVDIGGSRKSVVFYTKNSALLMLTGMLIAFTP